MAALSQSSKGKTLLSRLKSFLAPERFKCSLVADEGRAHFSSDTGACSGSGQVEFPKWRKIDSRNLGLTRSMISFSSWEVLRNLRAAGFEAYLVGGCVRDLLLNKIPKDFDVITTASLKQVKKKFNRAMIVGQRFPICRVIMKGCLVEVSSFDTVAGKSNRKKVGISEMPKGCDPKDFLLWKNCMSRDFTVNSLFYDPSVNVIFDCTNAMADLRSLKLRTVTPAHLSFREDEARILRGLRLAARLNLSFSKETEAAVYSFSSLVANLSTSRISLEMNYMLSYGAAEPSLLLLKRFKLLENLLPFHAAYISEQVDNQLGIRSLMLMKLFFNLDQLITCDRPCNESLWVAISAFHLALFGNPQHAVVVLTFASLLYSRTWEQSVKFARESVVATRIYVPEILDPSNNLSDNEIAERVSQFAVRVEKAVNVLTNKDYLSEAMARFPGFPCSGVVFVSQKMGQRVKNIFHILAKDVENIKAKERSGGINYQLLKDGDVCEIRFVLGKIILSTLLYRNTPETGSVKPKEDNMHVKNPPQNKLVRKEIPHADKDAKKKLHRNTPEKGSVKAEEDHMNVTNPPQKLVRKEIPHADKDANKKLHRNTPEKGSVKAEEDHKHVTNPPQNKLVRKEIPHADKDAKKKRISKDNNLKANKVHGNALPLSGLFK